MLRRSLGASSFAGFWHYWNRIWGYYLSRYVNAPLRRVLPAALAVLATFIVSGAIHDAVISLVVGSIRLLFLPWFALLGLGVVLTSWAGLEYRSGGWTLRAVINVALVLGGLGLTLLGKRVIGLQ